MGRFQDNVTQLNAVTLNALEEDMKRLGLPIYNATYDSSDASYHTYKITDGNFNSALKIGYTFVMIPDATSQGSNNRILMINHINSIDPLYWNNSDAMPNIGQNYAKVNNMKYLVAGRPYIVKCFAKVQNNYQFIISEMYQDIPASQNKLGGVKIWVSGSTLNISTNN